MSKTMLNLWLFFVAIMAFFPTSVTLPDRSGVTVSDNSAMIPHAVAMSRLARSEGSGFFFPDVPIVEAALPLVDIEEILARFDEADDNGADEVETIDSAGMHSNLTAVQSGLEWAHDLFCSSRSAIESSYQNAHRHLANFMVLPSTAAPAAEMTTPCFGPAYLRGTVNRRLADCVEPEQREASDDENFERNGYEVNGKAHDNHLEKSDDHSDDGGGLMCYLNFFELDGDGDVIIETVRPEGAESQYGPNREMKILVQAALLIIVIAQVGDHFDSKLDGSYLPIVWARSLYYKKKYPDLPAIIHYDRLELKPGNNMTSSEINRKLYEQKEEIERIAMKDLEDLINKTRDGWDRTPRWFRRKLDSFESLLEHTIRKNRSDCRRLHRRYHTSTQSAEDSANVLFSFYREQRKQSGV